MLYGDNGILNKAKFASEEYKNATEEEKQELAKVDDYVENSRATETNNMCAPILLTKAKLPDSGSSTRAAGTYLASSSSYTKENTEQFSKYLTFQEETGWKVEKSGWYYFVTHSSHQGEIYGAISSYFIINNINIIATYGALGSKDSYTGLKTAHSSIYLKQGDEINFLFKPEMAGSYSFVYFWIYAMFE